jgi:hypothetical protein
MPGQDVSASLARFQHDASLARFQHEGALTVQRAAPGSVQPPKPAVARTVKPPRQTATAGVPVTQASEREMDELARRLVGPISRLLRTELRLDRERVGRLRDTRR